MTAQAEKSLAATEAKEADSYKQLTAFELESPLVWFVADEAAAGGDPGPRPGHRHVLIERRQGSGSHGARRGEDVEESAQGAPAHRDHQRLGAEVAAGNTNVMRGR